MQHSSTKQSGFTLVELAIVLVIIGLIVGGVLVGQDLIKAATIRSTVSDIEKYNAAATTFRGKYSGLPGDLLNTKAVEFGLNKTDATDAGRNGAAGKGDGNAIIEGCAAASAALGCETALFWTDLSAAGLIPAKSTLTSLTATAQASLANSALGAGIIPKTKLRDSALITVFNNQSRNFYAIGNLSTGAAGAVATAAGITPLEARGIDEKLDDGQPLSGTVSAIKTDLVTAETAVAAGVAGCVATSGTASVYNSSTDALLNAIACSISLRTSF